MVDILAKVEHKKEPGFLYFIDEDGDLSRVRMAHNKSEIGKKVHTKVALVGIEKDNKKYFYFPKGDGKSTLICRAAIERGRKRR